MKILSWNTNYWQKQTLHAALWQYLDETLNPDIALLQESVPLQLHQGFIGEHHESLNLSQCGTYIWEDIDPKRRWGSGVFTKNLPIRQLNIKASYPGALTVAEVKVGEDIITTISIYGLLENGYSITSLHRMLSDLTLLLDGKLGTNRKIILAGDFNASLQFDQQQSGESHRLLFDRLENFGLCALFPQNLGQSSQTLRSDKSAKAWHIDHFYVSKNLLDKVRKTEVLFNEQIKALSDHNPLMVEIDL